jgi:hypothetical protein
VTRIVRWAGTLHTGRTDLRPHLTGTSGGELQVTPLDPVDQSTMKLVCGDQQRDCEILHSAQNDESLLELNRIPARVNCSIFSLE